MLGLRPFRGKRGKITNPLSRRDILTIWREDYSYPPQMPRQGEAERRGGPLSPAVYGMSERDANSAERRLVQSGAASVVWTIGRVNDRSGGDRRARGGPG